LSLEERAEHSIDICRRSRPSGSWKCFVIDCYPVTMREPYSLDISVDRILIGFCSPSMHGTLLDQRVFEALVQRCLPMIHDHFQEVDVQLSVASLPWFLSL